MEKKEGTLDEILRELILIRKSLAKFEYEREEERDKNEYPFIPRIVFDTVLLILCGLIVFVIFTVVI